MGLPAYSTTDALTNKNSSNRSLKPLPTSNYQSTKRCFQKGVLLK